MVQRAGVSSAGRTTGPLTVCKQMRPLKAAGPWSASGPICLHRWWWFESVVKQIGIGGDCLNWWSNKLELVVKQLFDLDNCLKWCEAAQGRGGQV